jgi:hypothetical protein
MNHKILLDNFDPGDDVTFSWPMPVVDPLLSGGTARTVPSGDLMDDSFTNTTGIPLYVTYTVTPYYNGCPGDPRDIVVTVGSEPVLDPGLDMVVCSDLPTGLVLKVAAGSEVAEGYNITNVVVQGGLVADFGASPVPFNAVNENYLSGHRFKNTQGVALTVTYTVVPYFGLACVGEPVDVVVTVNPQPVISTGNESICSETAPTLELVTDIAGSTFAWQVVAIDGGITGTTVGVTGSGSTFPHTLVNPSHDLAGSVTYRVRATSPQGCVSDAVDIVVTVRPLPNTPPIAGATTLCAGEINQIFEVAINAGSSYDWSLSAGVGVKKPYGGGLGDAYIIYDFPVAGSQYIAVRETNSFGCQGELMEKNVLIAPKPAAAIITGIDEVCALTSGVEYRVPGDASSAFTWFVPAGTSVSSQVFEAGHSVLTVNFGHSSGKIRVLETNEHGCAGPINEIDVTVNPNPQIFDVYAGAEYCEGDGGVEVILSGSESTVDYTCTAMARR